MSEIHAAYSTMTDKLDALLAESTPVINLPPEEDEAMFLSRVHGYLIAIIGELEIPGQASFAHDRLIELDHRIDGRRQRLNEEGP